MRLPTMLRSLRPLALLPILALAVSACAGPPDPRWTYQQTIPPSGSPTASTVPTQPAPLTEPPGPGEPGFVPGTEAAPRLIDIATNDELLFDPTVVTVAQGETINFRITNAGKADHQFLVGPMNDAFAAEDGSPGTVAIAPHKQATVTYTFTGNGPYAFACHEPGHYENHMIGFIDVISTQPWVGTADQPRVVPLLMNDNLSFTPNEVSVAPGETVLFALSNVGTAATHEVQLGLAADVATNQVDEHVTLEADKIEPGHVDYLVYTFANTGAYAFACHQLGHYEAGMKGSIGLTP